MFQRKPLQKTSRPIQLKAQSLDPYYSARRGTLQGSLQKFEEISNTTNSKCNFFI